MQVPTGFEVLSLVVLTLGVVLSIWEGSIAGSPTGICIAVASTFCGAAMLSFSGKVISKDPVASLTACILLDAPAPNTGVCTAAVPTPCKAAMQLSWQYELLHIQEQHVHQFTMR